VATYIQPHHQINLHFTAFTRCCFLAYSTYPLFLIPHSNFNTIFSWVLCLPMWPLPLRITTKFTYTYLDFSVRTTCPASLSSLIWPNNNITKSKKLTVAPFKDLTLLLLHPLCTYILISTKFKSAFNPSSCLRAEDHVSERFPEIGNVLKTNVLWDVSRCSLLQRHRCFGGTYCQNLLLKDQNLFL
jgi:hypothetical protein